MALPVSPNQGGLLMVETSDRTETPKPTDFSAADLQGFASGRRSLEQFKSMMSDQAKTFQGLTERQGFPSSGTLLPDGSSTPVIVEKGADGKTERVIADQPQPPRSPSVCDDLRGVHQYDLTGKVPSYSFNRNGDGALFLPTGKDSGTLGIVTHDPSGQEHDTAIEYKNGQVIGAPRDDTPADLVVPPTSQKYYPPLCEGIGPRAPDD